VTVSSELGNKYLKFKKGGWFVEKLRYYQLPSKGSSVVLVIFNFIYSRMFSFSNILNYVPS
jgi:hypothetical protein